MEKLEISVKWGNGEIKVYNKTFNDDKHYDNWLNIIEKSGGKIMEIFDGDLEKMIDVNVEKYISTDCQTSLPSHMLSRLKNSVYQYSRQFGSKKHLKSPNEIKPTSIQHWFEDMFVSEEDKQYKLLYKNSNFSHCFKKCLCENLGLEKLHVLKTSDELEIWNYESQESIVMGNFENQFELAIYMLAISNQWKQRQN